MVTDSSQSVHRTRVDNSPLLHPIRQGDRLVMLGSCFAQYMGKRMLAEGFDVVVNPLGTLFNPFSIHNTIQAALEADSIDMPIFQADGEWRCWWANTRVKASSSARLVAELRQRYGALGVSLRQAQHLILTLGTNVCYLLKETKMSEHLVVTNCQRQPDKLFSEWRATVDEVVNNMTYMVERLLAVNPGLQIIFTVSPYRYHKYGYHGSQLAKATLLLAEDAIINRFRENCCYFPAYEILLDELRDYSFYASDGHHPAPMAIEVIWQRFQSSIITH